VRHWTTRKGIAALIFFTGADETPIIREWSKNPLWAKLDAVAQNRVYEFDRDLWTRSRGIMALKMMIDEGIKSGLLTNEPPADSFKFRTQ
jgi:ferric citrate transport system substrate-binding protein